MLDQHRFQTHEINARQKNQEQSRRIGERGAVYERQQKTQRYRRQATNEHNQGRGACDLASSLTTRILLGSNARKKQGCNHARQQHQQECKLRSNTVNARLGGAAEVTHDEQVSTNDDGTGQNRNMKFQPVGDHSSKQCNISSPL